MPARRAFIPFRLYQEGLDWTGRSSRTAFLAAVSVLGLPVAAFLLGPHLTWWSRLFEVLALLAIAALFVPVLGHVMRRLNDIGASGFWALVLLLPWVSLALMLILLFMGRSQKRKRPGMMRSLGFGAAVAASVLVLVRIFLAPYEVVAAGMKPTLLAGDIVMAGTMPPEPEPGQVMVFARPDNGQIAMGRVVAKAGDQVQISHGVLKINGVATPQVEAIPFDEVMGAQGRLGVLPRCSNGAVGEGAICRKIRFAETLPNGAQYHILDIGPSSMDDTAAFTVPIGHLFVLGDNRDDASDSRIALEAGGFGFVPVTALKGRAQFVLVSFSGRALWQVWTWRAGRLFKGTK